MNNVFLLLCGIRLTSVPRCECDLGVNVIWLCGMPRCVASTSAGMLFASDLNWRLEHITRR